MKRALLVIDVQNEYFSGALPVSHRAPLLTGEAERDFGPGRRRAPDRRPDAALQNHPIAEDTGQLEWRRGCTGNRRDNAHHCRDDAEQQQSAGHIHLSPSTAFRII